MFLEERLLTQHRLSPGNETAWRIAEEAACVPPHYELCLHPGISHELCRIVVLSSPQQPVPVKQKEKYQHAF